ncbi:hypothetical protein B0H14DRAFT_2597958 [Mycena olivaceomarginata]|nr:hypothetical protein B0H14DRAFT_2597958 [Mycena olivaceomarginata]
MSSFKISPAASFISGQVSLTTSAAITPRMDPEFSEDEFDRLLRDKVVPDAVLHAADLLKTEALGIYPQIIKPTFEADEYDIMLADNISSNILLACDEAECFASLSEMLLQGKGDDPQLWWYPRDFVPLP